MFNLLSRKQTKQLEHGKQILAALRPGDVIALKTPGAPQPYSDNVFHSVVAYVGPELIITTNNTVLDLTSLSANFRGTIRRILSQTPIPSSVIETIKITCGRLNLPEPSVFMLGANYYPDLTIPELRLTEKWAIRLGDEFLDFDASGYHPTRSTLIITACGKSNTRNRENLMWDAEGQTHYLEIETFVSTGRHKLPFYPYPHKHQ